MVLPLMLLMLADVTVAGKADGIAADVTTVADVTVAGAGRWYCRCYWCADVTVAGKVDGIATDVTGCHDVTAVAGKVRWYCR